MNRLSLCTVLVMLLLFTSCKNKETAKEEKVQFLATSPLKRDTTLTKDYVAQIHSFQHIELRALEKGYLQNIYVDEGKYVKEGQVMFRIMPRVYEAELAKAKAEVKAAEIEVLNAKTLSDKNIVSKNELLMAQAKLEQAEAEANLAGVRLSFTEIRAPFSGYMNHLEARRGSLLDEGDLLTTLSDNSKMWVYFNVPESEYLNIKLNANNDTLMKVNLLMANGQKFKYNGVVQTIVADFDNETGNIAFRATFPNPDALLRNGETGNIQVTLPFKNALMIPQKATFEVLEKKFVYVIDKNNTVKSREINIAAELPHIFIIKSGLEETDKILLEGLRQVHENDKIEYKFEKPESVISNLNLYAE
ncbi:MAG: efflux RND transporter periplasmic adaptor subunit [Bacteroidetes bacterium]|nr:efflux RND transporter periplasmic adaptor subunit [Bacteroidota bacterium]